MEDDMAKKKKDSKKSLATRQIKKKKDSKKSLALRQMRKTNQLPTMWFDDVLGPKSLPTWFSGENGLWTPAIHVLEKEDKFVVKFELPGVNEEDIGISVIGGKLIVQGEKKAESEVKKKGYSYRETSYGSFSRSITIPSIVDAEWISARFEKGVLEIDLPKIEDIQPKKINLTSSEKAKAIGEEPETASSVLGIDLPKIVESPPKKTNLTASEKAKAIGKETEAVSNANAKTGKSGGQTKA
jgi:HSP20 family protein